MEYENNDNIFEISSWRYVCLFLKKIEIRQILNEFDQNHMFFIAEINLSRASVEKSGFWNQHYLLHGILID